MSHLALNGFLAGFVILGAVAAFFLAKGLREGRFAMRNTFGLRGLPLRDGRDPCFIYRDDKPAGFWLEAGMQIVAVAACMVVIAVLLSVP